MRHLIWRTAAQDDVAEIVTYISARNPSAARRMRNLFEAAVRPLSEHPFLYRPGRIVGTRELVAHPNYVIVYVVTDTSVEIISVMHARQRYP